MRRTNVEEGARQLHRVQLFLLARSTCLIWYEKKGGEAARLFRALRYIALRYITLHYATLRYGPPWRVTSSIYPPYQARGYPTRSYGSTYVYVSARGRLCLP